MMNLQRFQQARKYAEKRLERELAATLVYHAIAHTRDEVVPAEEALARMEGIKGNALNLLLTAAWFHDLGYVKSSIYHKSQILKGSRKQGCGRMPAPLFSGFSKCDFVIY